MTLTGAKYSDTQKAHLFFEVHPRLLFLFHSMTNGYSQLQIFHTNALANAALIHELTGYQIPNLADNFERPSSALGDISLIDQHGHTLHVVQGNQYLSLKLSTPEPEATISDASQIEQLQPIAQRLVAYLSAHTLLPGEYRKPDLQLVTPPSETIRIGDSFNLQAQGDDFAIVDGASENCAAVICAGRREQTQQIEFYAVGEGVSELAVHVAHKETLVSGTKKWNVTVEAAD
jgi:hypothetical protein